MLIKNNYNIAKNSNIKEKDKLSSKRIILNDNARKNKIIKNKEKIKFQFIFFKFKYCINFLIILFIQMLIALSYSEGEDISSKYEVTIVIGGKDNITILNNDFKIWPSFLDVNGDIVPPSNNSVYNLPNDESHIIVMKFNTEITNCSNMFSGLSKLKKASFTHFDFSKVVDMSYMFNGCSELRSVYFRNPDTSKVTNMNSMFYGCGKLNGLDLSKFSTSIVTNMNHMFYHCNSLESMDLTNFNTDKVTIMTNMFYSCHHLTYLNISSFNTNKVSEMYGMFYNCWSLTSLNLTNFNISLISNLFQMFYNSSSLKKLDITSFDTSKIISMKNMFYNCSSLESLNLSNFNTEIVQDMSYMFYNCTNLTELDLSIFNTEKTSDMQYMFFNCNSLISLNLSNFNTQRVRNMKNMFLGCDLLESLDISNFNLESLTDSFNFLINLTSIKYLNMKNLNATNVEDMQYAFLNLSSLISLDISNIYTPSLKKMQYMFCNCTSIQYLDLSSFNTEKVIYMQYLFSNCTSLKSLILSSFDTKNVENMGYMFYRCEQLEPLNLSNFITDKVTTMEYMFYNCSTLKFLDLSNFNTELVVYMQNMFTYCESIESINLSSFKTNNVNNMTYMFYNCKSLKELDLSNFNTTNVYYLSYMIYNCDKLTSLDISNFSLRRVHEPDYYSSSSYYFGIFNFLSNLKSLQYLNITNVDASNFNNYYKLFYSLYNLVSIDLSNFKTSSSATSMNYMFYNCTKLEFLNLSHFITRNVRYMEYMFYNCKSLKILDLSGFNTERVSYRSYIFTGCSSLISLDISNFDLRNIGSFTFLRGLYSLEYLNLKNVKTYSSDLSYSIYNLTSLISIDLSNADISSVTNLEYFFYNCSSIQSIDLSNLNISNARSMRYMFNNCHKLEFVNLSNLNTRSLVDMGYMFNNCHNLQSINFTNFNTSIVNNMEYMFNGCSLIISLDLSNLDTSSVTSMYGMFSECKKLEYVNMRNINTLSLETMRKMFNKCSNLKYINFFSITDNDIVFSEIFSESSQNFTYCIKDETKILSLFNKIVSLNKTIRDCSFECYNHSMKLIINEQRCMIDCSKNDYDKYEYNYECHESCPKRTYLPNNNTYTCEDLICENYYDYDQKKCIDEIPEGFFLNDSELQTLDKCHPNCKTCDKKEDENSQNCKSCPESFYLFYGNCVSHCQNGFYIDEEDNNLKKCKCENKKCFKCSKESLSLSKGLCISCNDNYYQIFNDKTNREPYFNCYKDPEGYYLDSNISFYKECYPTCKTCFGEGNEFDNNCIECTSAYSFKYNNNCLRKCTYYYYIDHFNDYHCTKSEKCSNEYNKLIKSKQRCVEDCKIDDIFKYEYQFQCYKECPKMTKISEDDEFLCKLNCPEDKPYEIIKTQECVESCSAFQILNYLCVLNNKNAKLNPEVQDEFIKDILESYLSGQMDEEIENENNGVTYNDSNVRLQVVNYEYQKNSNNNVTSVELGECERKLRDYYKIPDDEILVIFKVEIFEEGIKIPIVKYKLYSGNGRENLDLSVCDGIKIDLLIPVSINEDEIFKYYLKSDYYNNICFAYTSENGTDITLKDRQKEFIDNNMTLCHENCEFDEYNKRKKRATCKCDIKNFTETEENFDMEAFYKYCANFTRLANLDVMRCYKNLFTKDGILNNYGSFIILPIIFFHIISYIIFNFRDFNLIRNKIIEITNFKKVFYSINQKKNNDNNINEIEQNAENKQNNRNNNQEKMNNQNLLKGRETILAENRLMTNEKNNSNNENQKNKEKKEEQKIKNTINSPTKKKVKVKKRKISNYSINALKTNDISSIKSSNTLDFNKKSFEYLPKGKIKEKNISILNNNDIKQNIPYIAFTDYEMNSLVYEDALKYDKRNYFQYYLSLIKTKHILLFAFHTSDYNSILIKINLFFFSFAAYFAVNALFFDDGTMHKIYTDGGKYDFVYQIPKIIYSSLITTMINSLIKHFSLSQRDILDIKQYKFDNNLDKKVLNVEKCLYYKFVIFFRLSFLFLLLFWYYISCFCVVYKNTQIQLIKDTLIGFSFCLIYPFGLYLIPGIFRIPSLKALNKKKEFLYKCSVLLQSII